MSETVNIGAQASGDDAINRLTSAVERLESSLSKLASTNTALDKMQKQMATMTKVMKTSFDELLEIQNSMEARSQRQAEIAGARRQSQDEARAEREIARQVKSSEDKIRKQVEFENKQHASANKYHYAKIEADDTAYAKQLGDYVKFWEKIVAAQVAAENTQKSIQQRRDTEQHNEAQRAAAEYTTVWEKMLAERQAIQERRDVQLHEARAREHADYVSWWDKTLATQAAGAARQLEMERAQQYELAGIRGRAAMEQAAAAEKAAATQAAAAERQRVLNTGFQTSSPASQLRTATQAQVYGGLGGNAAERYGSAAASADIVALRRELASIPGAAQASTRSLLEHNAVMNEGHSLARGLAGSLGGLWLTYGSIVPLAAGAALAASLKGVVSVGKEVENQLNFVYALSSNKEGVNLDQFLKINDTSLHSIVEASNAMRALAQNGLTASQSLQVLPGILDLATVGEMTVGQAALAATGAVSAFGLSFSEAGRVGDIFAKTAAESNTSVLAITESMKQASTVASLFHVTIEETAGVLGVLAKINVTGGAAGTSMTNMLTGLYEPTEKGKKALKELGLETMTATGALKPFTTLMDELRTKLAGFNDSAKVDLLGSIFTVRGVKAVQQVQENMDSYIQKVDEAKTATGFMRDVVMKLEDSTDGAFKRLGVSVQRTFVEGFQKASPFVQEIGLHLADAFKKGGDAETGLTNLSTNVARLTGFLIDNASAMGLAAAAWLGWKVLGGAAVLVNAATVATATLTAAQGAAAAAQATLTAANIAGASTTAMVTAAVEANTAVTVAGAAASTAWSAAWMAALGPIAIAIAAAAAAWLIFRDNTDAADIANTKLGNSLHVITEQLDKEIERLEKSEKLWNAREGRFMSESAVRPDEVDAARKNVSDIEAKIRASGSDPAKVRNAETVLDGATGMSSTTYMSRYAGQLEEADRLLAGLIEKQKLFNEVLKPKQALERVRQSEASLGDQLEKFIGRGNAVNDNGQLVQTNEAIRKIYLEEGNKLYFKLTNGRLSDPAQEKDRQEALGESFKQLQDKVNSMQAGRAPKVDRKGANAQFGADTSALQNQAELARMDEKMQQNALQEQYNRGEIGDIALINAKLEQKLALNQKVVDTARAAAALASGAGKVVAEQKADNVAAIALKQSVLNRAEAAQTTKTYLDQMADDDLKIQAKTLTDKGDLVQAFLLNYQAQYGKTIEHLTGDLERTSDAGLAAKLGSRLASLTRLEISGTNDANFKQDQGAFNAALSELQEKIATAKAAATADGGISGALGLAAASTTLQADLLPQLARMVEQMATISNGEGGTDAMITAANKAKGTLAKITGDLAKDAKPFGDAWDKVWKTMEGTAHSAWMSIGTGGKNAFDAIGKTLKAGILDMLYQLTVKKWMVNIGASMGESLGLSSVTSAASALAGGGGASGGGSLLSMIGTGSSAVNAGSTLATLASGGGIASSLGSGFVGSVYGGMTGAGAGAGLTSATGLAIGESVAAIAAAIPGWGWAALAAVAAYSYFSDSGPEQSTRLGFTSNNTAGNISINERGNEGKSSTYIDPGVSSAFGTFGVSSSFWMSSSSPTVKDFLATVAKTDNALAGFLTSTEKASVSSYLTGKTSTAVAGAEGTDPNDLGGLDHVFTERIHNVMAALGDNLNTLTDGFVGTSQELATEAGKILQFRQALQDGGVAVFGMTTSLQDLAKLAQPAEAVSDTFNRVTSVFNVTNQIAAITGKSVEKMFGTVGIASFDARNNLVQAAGGLTTLSSQVSSYSSNFLTSSQKSAGAMSQVRSVMDSLNLSSVTSKAAFAKVVSGIDTTTPAGAKLFASLMSVQQAFNDVYTASEGVTKGLQDQINQLTLTRAELLKKERDELDPINQGLFDQLQQQKRLADVKNNLSDAYDREVTTIKAANDKFKQLGETLRAYSVTLGANGPTSTANKYQLAKDQFETTVSKAKGGDTKAQDALQSTAQAFLEASKTAYASSATYVTDYQTVTGVIDNMAVWADQQVDVGTASLETLRLQVGALTEIKDAILTLPQALQALADIKAPGGDLKAQIADVYKQVLGTTPDATTLNSVAGSVSSGSQTVADVAAGLRNNDPYTAAHHPQITPQAAADQTAQAMQAVADQVATLNAQTEAAREEASQHAAYVAEAVIVATAAAAEAAAIARRQEASRARYESKYGRNNDDAYIERIQ